MHVDFSEYVGAHTHISQHSDIYIVLLDIFTKTISPQRSYYFWSICTLRLPLSLKMLASFILLLVDNSKGN